MLDEIEGVEIELLEKRATEEQMLQQKRMLKSQYYELDNLRKERVDVGKNPTMLDHSQSFYNRL